MNVLRWGARMMERTSPAGLILIGAALALTLPPVRQRLRLAAVLATRGILTVTDTLQDTVATLREEMEDLVSEARKPAENVMDEIESSSHSFMHTAKRHGRRMAVSATAGAMALRHELGGIVDDARNLRNQHVDDDQAYSGKAFAADGLEANETDIGPDANESPKRRIQGNLV